MDLRAYYRKLRGIEAELREDSVVIISRETPDGGRAGVKSDVPRALAARLMVDEKADLATPEEAAGFRAEVEGKWRTGHGSQRWARESSLSDGGDSLETKPAREPACRRNAGSTWTVAVPSPKWTAGRRMRRARNRRRQAWLC